ncbi:MAG: glycosyltransferase [Chloroflexota bacterium]|jgi:L-malate glycosyltransferase
MSRHVLHQLITGATTGDAITEQALLMRGWLRDLGFHSDIYAWHIHPSMEMEVRPLAAYRRARQEEWAIYRHSIGSEVPDFLSAQSLRLILIYHNITPAEYFEGTDPMRARMARLGQTQLHAIRPQTGIALADSPYNAAELTGVGYRDVEIMPICLPAERYDVSVNPALAETLADHPDLLLFIGRLAPNKRQEDLVRLLYCLRRIRPQARLYLVGDRWDIGYDTWIEELAGQLDLDDGVVLTGKISHRDMITYLKSAGCYVSMSEHEGFGVPLIESMVLGLPVLAYGAAAVPDTMGNAGVLFYRKAYEPLAELIDLILTDQPLRERIIAQQYKRAQAFSEPLIRDQFEGYLAKAGLC